MMYADDLTLMSPSAKGLQKLLNICESFAADADILFNPDKSVCLYFECRTLKLHAVPYVTLNGKRLEYRLSHRILGMDIDSSALDNKDISRQVRGLYFRANMLIRKFSTCTYEVKKQLFISYCTSMYCAHLWSGFNLGQIKKLKVAYNNSFRRLFRLPFRCSASEMFVENDVPAFDILIRRNVYSFERRLKCSDNLVLKALMSCDHRHHSKLQARWDSLLRQ